MNAKQIIERLCEGDGPLVKLKDLKSGDEVVGGGYGPTKGIVDYITRAKAKGYWVVIYRDKTQTSGPADLQFRLAAKKQESFGGIYHEYYHRVKPESNLFPQDGETVTEDPFDAINQPEGHYSDHDD